MNQDLQHLKLLSIFHYVVGGLLAVCSCFLLIYLAMGVAFVAAPPSPSAGAPPSELGWFIIVFSTLGLLFGWTWAVCVMVAGWSLHRRKHYIFCIVMAGIVCLFQPFGTILGVFTLIVLLRPSVKQLFETGKRPYDPDEDDEEKSAFDAHFASGSYNIQNDG